MITGARVLALLQSRHRGIKNRILGWDLVSQLVSDPSPETDLRRLRRVVAELRAHGHPIASHSSYGYWYADTPDELAMTQRNLKKHAMRSLKVASFLEKRAMPALSGQLEIVEPVSEEVQLPIALVERVKKSARRHRCSFQRALEEAVSLWLEANGYV